jgi:hypothetical protein
MRIKTTGIRIDTGEIRIENRRDLNLKYEPTGLEGGKKQHSLGHVCVKHCFIKNLYLETDTLANKLKYNQHMWTQAAACVIFLFMLQG